MQKIVQQLFTQFSYTFKILQVLTPGLKITPGLNFYSSNESLIQYEFLTLGQNPYYRT